MTSTTILLAWIVFGQSLHSLLRTSGVISISRHERWKAVSLNAASHIIRATVTAGTVSTLMDSDWRGVAAVAVGSVIGDWIAMRRGNAP